MTVRTPNFATKSLGVSCPHFREAWLAPGF